MALNSYLICKTLPNISLSLKRKNNKTILVLCSFKSGKTAASYALN